MTKKVGILTFHWADNYGAVLQAYALQNYIKRSTGYHVEIINFTAPEFASRNKIFNQVKSTRNPIKIVKTLIQTIIYYKSLTTRHYKFEEFRKNELILSKSYYTTLSQITQSPPNEDYYITGSDQVFNPKFKYTDIYYLNFPVGKAPKIAYAPSFGISTFDNRFTPKIKEAIKDFDYLSCREKDGACFLSKIVNKVVPNVSDPTFLLTKEEWSSIIIPSKIKEKFIFVYDLSGDKKLLTIAHRINVETGYKVICCTNNLKNHYRNCIRCYNLGPKDFLGYIKEAQYVITDSFHGTVLSLILDTKVISYIAQPKVSQRILSIMKELNLEEQVIYSPEHFNLNKIRFNGYTEALNNLINKSKFFLSNALK